MNRIPTMVRTLAGAILCLVLSACAVYSGASLIDDGETTAPLGSSFAVLFYEETPEGYAKDVEGEAMTFFATGTAYRAESESMTVRFVPRGPGKYILAVETTEGYVYGLATIGANHVVEIHMVLDDDVVTPVESKLVGAPPEIKEAITVASGGIEVRSRAGLDFLIGMFEAGEIGREPRIGYIATSATDHFPSLIRKDGDAWVIAD